MNPQGALPIALTMGEPAGIGGEIALKAWGARERNGTPAFFVIDDPMRLELLARKIGLDVPFEAVAAPEDAIPVFDRALPVLVHPLAKGVSPGSPDPANAAAVISAIERAVEFVTAGRASAVVTNPIHKKTLYDSGFAHPGHTEFLAKLAGDAARPVMMLACPGLRVVPATVHLGLAAAITALSTELLVEIGSIVHDSLVTDFGITAPRISVVALNPHASEGGSLGREEAEIIAPAIEALVATGIAASGPVAADAMFHPAARKTYDAALCMYHDQALIPLKTLDFARGVNITLGLPFVRTSPDHGTAFGLAGSGRASAASLSAALAIADAMAGQRNRATEQQQAV